MADPLATDERKDRHGPVRRPRRLHRTCAAARPGADARGARPVLRRGDRGALRASGRPGEVHRRRGHGGVRSAPAHEDDALRAVRAGLAIRGRLRRLSDELGLAEPLEIRVGVESGEAATGVGPAGQLLITGPVVNAAARLQAAAEPGEVLVGETTRALTGDGGLARRASSRHGEGLRRRPRRLSRLGSHHTVGPAHDPVRRACRRARDRFASSLARVQTSAQPLLFTVIGEPGIGKSRLLDEFVAGLDREVLIAHRPALVRQPTAPRSRPSRAWCAMLAGIDDGDPPEKARRRLQELVERAARMADPARTDRSARACCSVLASIAARSPRSSTTSSRGSSRSSMAFSATGRWRCSFDDAHTLRPPMLDLIERLGARATRRAPHGDGPRRRSPRAAGGPADLGVGGGEPVLAAARAARRPRGGRSGAPGGRRPHRRGGGRSVAARAGGNPFFIVESTGLLIRLRDDQDPPPAAPRAPAHRPGHGGGPARRAAPGSTGRWRGGSPSICTRSIRTSRAGRRVRHGRTSGPRGRRDHRARRVDLVTWRAGDSATIRFATSPMRACRNGSGSAARRHRGFARGRAANQLGSGAPRARGARVPRPRSRRPRHSRRGPRTRCCGQAIGLAAGWRAARPSTITDARHGDGDPTSDRALRSARALAGHGRGALLARRVPGGHPGLDRAITLGEDDRRRLDPGASASIPRRHRDQRRGRHGQGRGAAGSLARTPRSRLASRGRSPEHCCSRAGCRGPGNSRGGGPLWRRALEIAREHGDQWAEVRALTSLSINEMNADRVDDATR